MKDSVLSAIFDAATLASDGRPIIPAITDYEKLPEAEAAFSVLDHATEGEGVRDLIYDLYNAFEEQGFRNGLRYGVRLAIELGLTKREEAQA